MVSSLSTSFLLDFACIAVICKNIISHFNSNVNPFYDLLYHKKIV